MLMTVISKQRNFDPVLDSLNIKSNQDTYWADTGIRSEDVKHYYSLSKATTVVEFYDAESLPMVIKEKFADFAKRLEEIEYASPSHDKDEA